MGKHLVLLAQSVQVDLTELVALYSSVLQYPSSGVQIWQVGFKDARSAPTSEWA